MKRYGRQITAFLASIGVLLILGGPLYSGPCDAFMPASQDQDLLEGGEGQDLISGSDRQKKPFENVPTPQEMQEETAPRFTGGEIGRVPGIPKWKFHIECQKTFGIYQSAKAAYKTKKETCDAAGQAAGDCDEASINDLKKAMDQAKQAVCNACDEWPEDKWNMDLASFYCSELDGDGIDNHL